MTEQEHEHDSGHGEGEQIHMPAPSIWPMTLAFAVSAMGLGILTNWVFILFGAAFGVWAIWGWAQEMRHESA